MIVLNEEVGCYYVKDDLSEILEFGLKIKDILMIKAIKFRNVYTNAQVIKKISNLGDGNMFNRFTDRLGLEKQIVSFDAIRPPGTHAYEIKTAKGLWVYPIWEKYIESPKNE